MKSIETLEAELLEQCPGSCGELARAINASLPANAPMIALANAFLACGQMRAGKLQCDSIQANSYHVVVALSGAGKTEAQKRFEWTLETCGFGAELMGDFTSEAALLCELQGNPHRVVMLDEFGRALYEMGQSSGYRGEALTTLLKMYSASNSLYRGKSYAMNNSGAPRPAIVIERPMVSVLGSSTPSSFFQGMSSQVALDGLLGRFFLWFAQTREPESREGVRFEVPKSVKNEAAVFKNWPKTQGNLQLYPEAKSIVPYDTRVFAVTKKEIADRFRAEPLELKSSLLARAGELFAKFCIALSDERGNLSFEAMRYARKLLFVLYDIAWEKCGERMGASRRDEEYYVKREKVLSKIPFDREITTTELGQTLRRGLQLKERRAILADLVDTGEVLELELPTPTKPVLAYRRLKYNQSQESIE